MALDNNLTHSVVFFVAEALAIFGQFLDCQTTDVALAHGMVEANSLSAKIYKKIGQTGFFVLKCAAVPASAALAFALFDWITGLCIAIPFATIGLIAGINNYLLLRKNKISTFGV